MHVHRSPPTWDIKLEERMEVHQDLLNTIPTQVTVSSSRNYTYHFTREDIYETEP